MQEEKCIFGKESVPFLGFQLTTNGITFDQDKFIKSINSKSPTNKKELASFLGPANYFRSFIKNYNEYTHDLYNLFKKDVTFEWNDKLESKRLELLNKLSESNILAYPTNTDDNVIETDASGYGIGSVLLQNGKVVSYYSRSLNSAELNYSTIEKECLAIIESVKYFKFHCNGRHIKIITDHQPLQYLLSGKFNNRITKWIIMLQEYNYEIIYRPGKLNYVADALSRNPIENVEILDLEISTITTLDSRIQNNNSNNSSNNDSNNNSDNSFRDIQIEFNGDLIRNELKKDLFYNAVYRYLEENVLPEDKDLARRVLLESEFFVVIESILYRGIKSISSTSSSKFLFLKIVIPPSLVIKILEVFHDSPFTGGHFGFAKTYKKINERFYWRGMVNDVKHYVENCVECLKSKNRYGPHPGFLIPIQIVTEPFHTIGIDFIGPFDCGNERKSLLVIMDYFTKWPEAFFTTNQEAETVARVLVEQIFFRFGAPKRIVSDRGTNFLSKVIEQVNTLFGIKKLSTTSYHPQINGLTENFNKTLITMLKNFVTTENYGEWPSILRALLFAYRTIVHSSTGFSPFYLLFNRQPRLPIDTFLRVNYNNELILTYNDSQYCL
ncbi:hypothetical protein ACTFIU_001364 [Dictyostelium citrinum]